MRKSIFLLASIALSTTALAAEPTVQSIDTLLAVTRVERQLDGMLSYIDTVMKQSMANIPAGPGMTPERQRAMEASSAKVRAIFQEEMTWAKLQPVYEKIYAETFTQDEIDGLIAFYRTPTGQSYIDKQPVVLQKSIAATQVIMAPMMQRVQAVMKQSAEDAKADAKP